MESENLPKVEIEKQKYDAIVVLGAFMQRGKDGSWKLPTIIEEDPGKVVGGHSRAIAAEQAYIEGLSSLFLVTGGVQTDDNESVSRAQILADLMTDKYDIPKGVVEVIGTYGNGNTMGNVRDVVNYLESHPEIIKNGRLGILSNNWHLERALVIFSQNPYFEDNQIELMPIVAEDLLEKRSNHYSLWRKSLESTPEMKHRMSMEKKGMEALSSGKYKPKSS